MRSYINFHRILKKTDEGFSLLEILAVLVIIAVLVGIAIPIYASTQQAVKDTADDANVRILNSATLQWMMADEDNNSKVETTASLRPKLAGYLAEWPVSPNGYSYGLENGVWKVGE